MRAELAEMRDTIDKNMVYVTYDQVEATTLGDRIVVMSDGLIQQQGTPEELFKAPVNKFVAGFIGSPKMNFIDGEIFSDEGALRIRGDGLTCRSRRRPPRVCRASRTVRLHWACARRVS
jgi:multiple sugar transport system ATP-binding protein